MTPVCPDQAGRRASFVNDEPLPEPGPVRRKINRLVDHVAFGLIKHCLSRARHQRFDFDELDRYAARWIGSGVDEFYALPDFPESEANSSLLRQAAGAFRPRFELTLDTPLRSGYPDNDRFRLDFHLARPLGEAPVFVILHGWRSVSVKGYHRMCRELNARGINAIVTHLPYHFARTPRGTFNGELAISADLARSGNGLRQGVVEMRWLCRELKAIGAPAFGLWGTSYGGWISAMAATVDPLIDAILILEPPVEIERIFWEVPLFEKLTAHLEVQGVAREPIRHLFDLVSPHRHTPKIDPRKIVILGSLYDHIATPHSLQLLHRAWPGSHVEIFPYAHISYRLHLAALDLFCERLLPFLQPQRASTSTTAQA